MSPSNTIISILIADDHEIVRKGLTNVLSLYPEMKVVGEAQDGRDAVEKALRLCPDVILLDLEMPVLSGTEVIYQIKKKLPATRILVLTGHDDKELVAQIVRSGAHGYLLKTTSMNELREAIKRTMHGEKTFSESVAATAKDSLALKNGTSMIEDLTDREREILQLIAQGRGHQEISELLSISIRTVDTHRQNIQRKLDIHDGAGLTRYAIRKGMIIIRK